MRQMKTWVMRAIRMVVLAIALAIGGTGVVHAVDNPASRLYQVYYDGDWRQVGINDCGVMKYNGEYYIQGNWLWGHMLAGNDLTNWTNPTHVITHDFNWPNVHGKTLPDADHWIHASTPYYLNGVFHLYFGIDDEVGHATANNPWGPYLGYPDNDTPFTPSAHIDSNMFIDEDGVRYFYYARFTGGNVIWGKQLNNEWSFSGSGQAEMIHAENYEWENYDEATMIAEGPWVFKYRDKYYMIYNGNGTSEGWSSAGGNYAFGCAQSNTPLGFRDSNKLQNFIDVSNYAIMDSSSHLGPEGRIAMTGQPWVVEGPNGFEKWLGYFAIDDPDGWGGRYQCADRLHFFDRRVYADGPTGIYTDGFHPAPAQPQYLGLFTHDNGVPPQADEWKIANGNWQVLNNEMNQWSTAAAGYINELRVPAAENFLFEINLKFVDNILDNQAGVRFYIDDDNWLLIGIHRTADASNNNFYYHLHEGGGDTVQSALLPTADFNIQAYHKLRVMKNGTEFRIWLDDRVYAPVHQFTASTFGAGTVSLYSNYARTSWDGLIHTVGWDEYDSHVNDWGASASGIPVYATWSTGASGISQTDALGLGMTFKGDLMDEYEVSTQVTVDVDPVPNDGQDRYVGFIPVAIDLENYVYAAVYPTTNSLLVASVVGGVVTDFAVAPLTDWVLLDTAQAVGQTGWKYTTSDPGSGWEATGYNDSGWADGTSGFGDGGVPFGNVNTTWTSSDIWIRKTFTLNQPITPYTQLKMHHDDGVEVYINGVLAQKRPRDLGSDSSATGFYKYFEISGAARATMQTGSNVIAVHCHEDGGDQYIDVGIFNPKLPPPETASGHHTYNLRAVKLADKIHFFVNGQQLATLNETYGPSQVGLLTNNLPATFNGILTYERAALPDEWTHTDVGPVPVAEASQSEYSLGSFKIEGAGLDIWNNEDAFTFVHQPWTGDGWIEARVTEAENIVDTGYWAKNSIMIREDLDGDSAHASVTFHSNGEYLPLQWRDAKGAGSAAVDAPVVARPLPHWLKLKRAGNTYTGYHSEDGLTWSQVHSLSFTMASNTHVGLASCAFNNNALLTSKFDNVRVLAPIPSPWQEGDVGTVGVAGVSGYRADTGTFHIDGSGDDIWNNADAFRYVQQPWTGDVWLEARVTKVDNTDYWAKAGVMVRESLATGSRHASALVTPSMNPTLTMARREATNGASGADDNTAGLQAPYHVRLVREGNTFTTWHSPDALTWTQLGQHTFTMNASAHAGLVVTAHNTSDLNRATLDSVRLMGLPPSPWVSTDIGSVGYAGMSGYHTATSQFEIDASGAGIAGTADAFRFVHQPLSGNGSITARIVSVEDTDPSAKAGVMIRGATTAGSGHHMISLNANGDLEVALRQSDGAASGLLTVATGISAPIWVRLVYADYTACELEAYYSTDGSTWNPIDLTVGGTQNWNLNCMGGSVQIGMAVTGNDNGDLCTANIDNVTVTVIEGVPPTAAIDSALDVTATGASSYTFTIDYTDNVAIDVSTLDASDIRVTGPGYIQLASFIDVAPSGNGSPRTATYSIVPPGGAWDTGDNGAYAIAVEAAQVADTSANTVVAGSLGGFNVNIETTPPGAAIGSAPDVTASGASNYSFTVTYSDNAAVSVATLDGSDIRVTGTGFDEPASFVSSVPSIDASSIVATYSITARGGAWDTGDNGTYTIALQSSQVADINANFAMAGSLGTFDVNIETTPPGAAIGAAPDVTTGGGATYSFEIVYTDNTAVDVSTLDGSDIRVTGPGAFDRAATFDSVTPLDNGSPRTATYSIVPPGGAWNTGNNGTYTITLQSSQVADTNGNLAVAGSLGTFEVNIPTATQQRWSLYE